MTVFLDEYVGRLVSAFPGFRAFGDGDAELVAQEREYKLELCALFSQTLEASLRLLALSG